MFRHTFNTWLLANLIHPAIIILYLIIGESADISSSQAFAGYLYFFWISLVVSLPCLFIGWGCLSIISRSPNPVEIRFILWLLTAPSLAFVECLAVPQLFGLMDMEALHLTIPAMMGTALSVSIRYRYFKNCLEPQIKIQA